MPGRRTPPSGTRRQAPISVPITHQCAWIVPPCTLIVANPPSAQLPQGCYIGQETLAKLSNKDGVKQQLWGLALDGPVAAGSVVEAIEPAAGSSGQADASGSTSSSTSSGVPMGRVTSVVKTFKVGCPWDAGNRLW